MHVTLQRHLHAQVVQSTVQWGGRTPKAGGRELDGRTRDEIPARGRSRVAPAPGAGSVRRRVEADL